MADYHKIGLFTQHAGRVLLCRKGTLLSKLILPGGRIEAGETAEECLAREIREELGDVTVEQFDYLGTYEDRAASDDLTEHKTVEIRLYQGELRGEPVASSEIIELVWFGADSDPAVLSPILLRHIFPDLRRRGLLFRGER